MKNGKEMKFKNIILHNFVLKILAVILAVVLWVVIVNIDNPSRTTTISGIQVVLLNEETLVDKGYTYAIQSGATLSITVKAPQSVVENLEATDFYAYADLSELSPVSDRTPISVRCEKTEIANQVDIVSLKSDYVQLAIDNKKSKDVPIEGIYTGTPATNYVVGECYVSPTTVTVTGAEKLVDRIETARVTYNISNMTQSVSEEAKITFYDSDGREVKSDLLSLSRNTAKINIEIEPTKKVDVNFATIGDPKEGYVIGDVKASLDSVIIAANKNILDKISAINIPAGDIDTNGIEKDSKFTVPLSIYLPAGCRIISAETNLEVDVEVLRKVEIEIPYEKISLVGCSNVYDYEIVHDKNNLVITVIGESDIVEQLTANDFYLTASVGGKTIGRHTVRVNFDEDDKYKIVDTYEIVVAVTEKKTIEDPTTSEEETTDKAQKETDEEKTTEKETKTRKIVE